MTPHLCALLTLTGFLVSDRKSHSFNKLSSPPDTIQLLSNHAVVQTSHGSSVYGDVCPRKEEDIFPENGEYG